MDLSTERITVQIIGGIRMRHLVTFIILLSSLALGIPRSGSPAPEFNLPEIEGGKNYRLSDFRGKVILLNFWASWCTGCRAEMPEFIKLQEEYGGENFVIVAVSVDSSPHKAVNFLKELEKETGRKVNFLVLYDSGKEVVKKYRPIGMPSSYLIDREGKLIRYFPSSFTEENIHILREAIKEAIR